jgi:putative transposase
LHAHLVFVTNYRRPVFTDAMLTDSEQLMHEVCTAVGAELRAFNGETDHRHLLVHHPPSIALSVLVNRLKGVSSRRLPQQYPADVRKYLWGKHFWSRSYFAASFGGAPLTIIKQYIDQQNRPDSTGPLHGPKDGIGFPPAVNGQASAEKRSVNISRMWIAVAALSIVGWVAVLPLGVAYADCAPPGSSGSGNVESWPPTSVDWPPLLGSDSDKDSGDKGGGGAKPTPIVMPNGQKPPPATPASGSDSTGTSTPPTPIVPVGSAPTATNPSTSATPTPIVTAHG